MVAFSPVHLKNWSQGEWTSSPCDELHGFSIDSRKISTGDVFVAIRAARDGHEFVKSAMENGASAALVEDAVPSLGLAQLQVENSACAILDIARGHRDNFPHPVVAITGSCGKTSTKEAMGRLLNSPLTTLGNLNNHLGVPLTLLRLDAAIHQSAVIEVGINHRGEMASLANCIAPDLVVITMIGQSHLAGLGGIEGVAEEKSVLWRDSKAKAIFPESCLQYDAFSKLIRAGKPHLVVRKGIDANSNEPNSAYFEFWTETNKQEGSGVLKIWHPESSELEFVIPAMSQGMASNMALSVLASLELGISVNQISERLPQYKPPALRGVRLQGRGREYFVDCYNANPSSLRDSMEFFFSQSIVRKKMMILGGMEELGPDEEKLHQDAGGQIHLGEEDQVVLVGQKASWMASCILENGARPDQVIVLECPEDCRSLVEDFNGNIFLKGSRKYKLEEIIPQWAVEQAEPMESVLC